MLVTRRFMGKPGQNTMIVSTLAELRECLRDMDTNTSYGKESDRELVHLVNDHFRSDALDSHLKPRLLGHGKRKYEE